MISDEQLAKYQSDGVIMLKGVFKDWVDIIAAGIERNMNNPGEFASENAVPEGQGRFFDDYCNWQRIPEFERVIRDSPAAELAARAMQSDTAQIFHDHVLVKDPGTPKASPWHQDGPYYFVKGSQTISLWIPVDPVDTASLRFIKGSHKWDRMVRPVSWADESDFYDKKIDWIPVPDPDADPDDTSVVEWQMEPGDVVLFGYKMVHGARGNPNKTRRRALSLRWLGDNARYTQRPGRTSPPFPGHEMVEDQRLREDWFPVIWPEQNTAEGTQ